MRTNLTDVYAIGDVASNQFRQITTAVSDGTIAAIALEKELHLPVQFPISAGWRN